MGKTYLLIATMIICMASGAFAGNLKALSNAVQVRSAGPQYHKPGPPFLKPGMIVKADFQSDLDKANEDYLKFDESGSDVSVNVKPKKRTRRPAAFGTQAVKREPRHRARGNHKESLVQVGEEPQRPGDDWVESHFDLLGAEPVETGHVAAS